MTDPFSVEPPQWLTNIVGRPVDMTSVGTAVGNFARQKLRGPTIEQKYSMLQRSQMQKEMEVMDSRLATETASELIKTDLLKQRTTGELEFATQLAEHGKSSESILGAPMDRFKTPHGVDLWMKVRKSAAEAEVHKQKQLQDVELTKGLSKVFESSPDVDISARASALESNRRQNGWTDENIREYGSISAAHKKLLDERKQAAAMAKSNVGLEIAKLRAASAEKMQGIKQEDRLESMEFQNDLKLQQMEQQLQNELALIDPKNAAARDLIDARYKNQLDLFRENSKLRTDLEGMKNTSRIETPTPEGGKVVQMVTAKEAADFSTLSPEMLKEYATFKEDQKELAAVPSDTRAGLGSFFADRKVRMEKTKLKWQALGYDVETGKRIKTEIGSPKTEVGSPASEEVLPYPASAAEAVKGKRYQTKNGPMTWDGTQFVK